MKFITSSKMLNVVPPGYTGERVFFVLDIQQKKGTTHASQKTGFVMNNIIKYLARLAGDGSGESHSYSLRTAHIHSARAS